MTRYIQIAALLPSKCVRDVALRIVREENIPKVTPNNGEMLELPAGISVVDPSQHKWINTILNDNVAYINTLRDNLVQQRAHQNMKLYDTFRAQAQVVQEFLNGLPIQLPEPNFAISTLFTDTDEKDKVCGSGDAKDTAKGKEKEEESNASQVKKQEPPTKTKKKSITIDTSSK